MTFNLMAVSYRTFGLGHVLIDCAFVATISIARSESQELLRCENNTSRQNFCLEGATAPTEASGAGSMKEN